MNFFKKNQVVIYVIALMLVVAGYLNYTTKNPEESIFANSNVLEASKNENIGDAQLVSSKDLKIEETNTNQIDSNSTNSAQNTENTENLNSVQNEISENQTNIKDTQNAENQTENNNQTTETSTNTTSDSYFTNSKLERETMYSQMIETYEKVLNSANSLEVQKQSATDEITKINNTKNSIMICENLIGTKGFDKNVIFVNGNSVTVIIGATELKEEDVAQIQNIISRELKTDIENIHISIK